MGNEYQKKAKGKLPIFSGNEKQIVPFYDNNHWYLVAPIGCCIKNNIFRDTGWCLGLDCQLPLYTICLDILVASTGGVLEYPAPGLCHYHNIYCHNNLL